MYAWYAQHPDRKAELCERFDHLEEAVHEVTETSWEETDIRCTDLIINEDTGAVAIITARKILDGKPQLVVLVIEDRNPEWQGFNPPAIYGPDYKFTF